MKVPEKTKSKVTYSSVFDSSSKHVKELNALLQASDKLISDYEQEVNTCIKMEQKLYRSLTTQFLLLGGVLVTLMLMVITSL